MVKVVIVGCGFMGQAHAAGYASAKGAEVRAFVDIVPKARGRLVKEFGGEGYETLEEALASENVEAVDICLPTDLNLVHVRLAARAKKHIMLEKPIAVDLKTTDMIIGEARRNRVILMVGHVLRFWPEYVVMKRLIDSGGLGKIVSAEAVRLCETPAWSPWFLDPKRSGGGIMNLGIHDIDFLNWLFGKPHWLCATGVKSRRGSYDDMETVLRYPKNVSASVKTCMTMPKGFPFTMMFRARGSKGTVEFIFRTGGNLEARGGAQSELTLYSESGRASRPKVPEKDGYREEVAYFVRCVRRGEQPDTATGGDAKLAVRVGLAAIESAEKGKRVRI